MELLCRHGSMLVALAVWSAGILPSHASAQGRALNGGLRGGEGPVDRSTGRAEASVLWGDAPGADLDGFRVGGFVPLLERSDFLFFTEGNASSIDESSEFAGDIGLGLRKVWGTTVLGTHVFYNHRQLGVETTTADFSTLGLGFEFLSRHWSVRSHAFFEIGGTSGASGSGLRFVSPRYAEVDGTDAGVNRILIAQTTDRMVETVDGGEITISRLLPRMHTELGGGLYFLETDQRGDHVGVQGSLECSLTSHLTTRLTVSHDDLFATNVLGQLQWSFGGPSVDVRSRSESQRSRLWSRVRRRRVTPLVVSEVGAESVYATDASTGDYITVIQSDTGSDLTALTDRLEVDGEFVDIILAAPGSTYTPVATIGLNDDQRFLSAHRSHTINTSQRGTIRLPESNLGGAAASLTATSGFDVVTLANRNEVHGFDFDTTSHAFSDHAISGNDVTDFEIYYNRIGGRSGIDIDAGGLATLSGTLTGNEITDSFVGDIRDGIHLSGQDINVDFSNNVVSGNYGDNVMIEATGDISGSFAGNEFNDSVIRSGIELEAAGDILADFARNTASGNDNDGIRLLAQGNIEQEMVENTAHGNGMDGIHLLADRDRNGSGDYVGTVRDNDAGRTGEGNGENGIFVDANNVIATITGNETDFNFAVGLRVHAANDIDATVDGNTAFENAQSTSSSAFAGIVILADSDFDGDGDVHGMISNNVAGTVGRGNLEDGLNVYGINVSADVVDNVSNGNDEYGTQIIGIESVTGLIARNTSSDNGSYGLSVSGADSFTGTLQGNRTDRNGQYGLEVGSFERIGGVIEDHSASDNGTINIWIATENFGANPGVFDGVFRNNTASGGGASSIASVLFESDNILGSITGNSVIDSQDAALAFALFGIEFDGVFSGNSSLRNAADGISFSFDNLAGNVSDNVASDNRRDGFDVNLDGGFGGGDFSAVFTGNVAEDNDLIGFRFQIDGDFSGQITGNSATGNGTIDYDTNADGVITGTISPNQSTTDSVLDYTGANPVAAP